MSASKALWPSTDATLTEIANIESRHAAGILIPSE